MVTVVAVMCILYLIAKVGPKINFQTFLKVSAGAAAPFLANEAKKTVKAVDAIRSIDFTT